MATFKTGKTYEFRSVCDHNCVWTAEVLGRSAKTITIRIDGRDTKTCKVHMADDGYERCFPLGRYSMAPVMAAVEVERRMV